MHHLCGIGVLTHTRILHGGGGTLTLGRRLGASHLAKAVFLKARFLGKTGKIRLVRLFSLQVLLGVTALDLLAALLFLTVCLLGALALLGEPCRLQLMPFKFTPRLILGTTLIFLGVTAGFLKASRLLSVALLLEPCRLLRPLMLLDETLDLGTVLRFNARGFLAATLFLLPTLFLS